MRTAKYLAGFISFFAGLTLAGATLAQDGITGLETLGKPTPKALGFQPSATELMRDIVFLDTMLLWVIAIISIFVTLLLAWVVVRYNARRNPVAGTFTHNSAVEIAWTIVPIVILIVVGAFSLPILFKQLEIPEADITIKATGNQWYWSYEYTDDNLGFDSFLLEREDLAEYGYAPDEYLLATDNAVVIPVNKNIVVQVTGSDVIHAWTIPAFGVKQDAVPGRLAELWFNAEKEGVYFGQCSELCGKDHAYMPITVKVVSQEVYDNWLKGAKVEFANGPAAIAVAAN